MKKAIAGIGALLLLAVLLIGIPAALIFLAGNPIPESWDALVQGVTNDWTGSFLAAHILPIIGWIAWAWLALGILSVIPSMIRGIEPPRINGLAVGQQAGRALFGTVLVMVTGFTGIAGANAAEPLTTSPHNSISVTQEAAAPATVKETPAPVAHVTTPTNPTVTVKDGDSLWSLAEAHLGDGNRFGEIAELNYGGAQADGHTLGKDHFINSGWVLKLPANTPVAQDKDIIVQPGQDLPGISQTVYGTPDKADKIFNASRSIVQADGSQIGVTGIVAPGYRLVAPATGTPAPVITPASSTPIQPAPAAEAPAPAAEAVTPTLEPDLEAADQSITEPTQSELAAPPAAAEQAPAEAETTPLTEAEDVASASEEEFPVSTLWGAGGVLAAGVLSVLGLRRLQQQRRRRAGERIAMPNADIAAAELELRAVEDPAGVEDIDRALHYIATWAHDNDLSLPKLFAVRLSPRSVEIYLDEAADLPAPFEAVSDDNCAWAVNPRLIPAFDPKTAAPYPALVTLGQDAADGHILVDLEQIGSLALTGSPETTHGALVALAIELACSKWSEDLRISLVGFAPELPAAFDTGRVRHISDLEQLLSELEARTSADGPLLDSMGYASSHDARVSARNEDPWPPEIVLLSELPAGKEAERLKNLVEKLPRIGLAAVSKGRLSGDWALDIDENRSASLAPAGLTLTAQTVDEASYTKILEALRTTLAAPVDAVNEPEPVSVPAVQVTPAAAPDPSAEQPATTDVPVDSSEPGDAEAAPESGKVLEIGHRTRRRAVPAEEITVELPDAPFIRVLGPVRVENAKGIDPSTTKGASAARCKEVITFLALHRHQSTEEYDQAIHPNTVTTANMRNPLASRARRWLGANAEGMEYFAKFSASNSYTLAEDVRTDWSVFQELVGTDPIDASTARLEAALELVTGQPFQGVRASAGAGRSSWAWSEPDQQNMIAAISDVAYELAERAAETSDGELMLKAATRGAMASPASEAHIRHKLTAYAHLGDQDAFESTVTALYSQCEALEEEGPEPETAQLIDALKERFDKRKAG